MAVDYIHRLVISGPLRELSSFRRRIRKDYPREVHGKHWTEVVPFSLAALYELAPRATRVEAEIPYEPYDISFWLTQRIDARRSELRYKFHTRNLEMHALLRVLSRALPKLRFVLVTLCLDDSSVESFELKKGTRRKWQVLPRRQETHWQAAREKFGLEGEIVYEDDDAEAWIEDRSVQDAFAHWGTAARSGRYSWFNRPVWHDLESERMLALLDATGHTQAP